ncbi:MAG: 2-keto-4-pentenoate hydratase [Mycobacterium sp.]
MPEDRSQTVSALLDAHHTRVPVDPPSESDTGLTVAQAYEIQLQQVTHWTGQGRVIKGHKVGLTSTAMQLQLGVDQPDYGHLFADMFYPESLPIDAGRFISPKVEPEIAFVLDQDLTGPGVTVVDALQAVGYVLPALEIIDSRIRDWRITLPDTIADNASAGGVVLGSTPVALTALDLRLTGCVLNADGQVAFTGAGAAVLGSPINALVWLANTLGALGVTLEAGSVVLPGSLTAALPVTQGSTITASFTEIGSVTACFAPTTEGQQ